jgi:6-phosphogluconate dehydrogenase
VQLPDAMLLFDHCYRRGGNAKRLRAAELGQRASLVPNVARILGGIARGNQDLGNQDLQLAADGAAARPLQGVGDEDWPMKIGMVGLGRMGSNMVRRLLRAGHDCDVFDISDQAVKQLVSEGAGGAGSLQALVSGLAPPRTVWLMLPAAITGDTVTALLGLLDRGDTIVDGGNSYYRDDVDRAELAAAQGVHYVDCGTSGGVWGLDRGYCLMIGGDATAVQRLDPIVAALAPGVAAAARTPGRDGDPVPAEQGYLHCGSPGAGHFVKMVHNGIEYALMAAYAEGLNIIRGAGVGVRSQEADAETAPLRDPRYYTYDQIDLAAVAEVWRRGSVIGSWLLDLTAEALLADPALDQFTGRVSDSGEGRWTSMAAIEEGVPAPLLTAALYSRFASRGSDLFADKVQSGQRKEFGGHEEKRTP